MDATSRRSKHVVLPQKTPGVNRAFRHFVHRAAPSCATVFRAYLFRATVFRASPSRDTVPAPLT